MEVIHTSDWTDASAPRIFRRPECDFNGDEPLQAPRVYTPEALGRMAAHGFNGFWVRGRLRHLMRSSVLPELNDPQRDERIAALRQTIEQGRQSGLGLYLYFNDPIALAEGDPFWQAHPDLAGEPHTGWKGKRTVALCLSTPAGARYMDQAAESVLRDLPGLAGVILITASEFHSHCWSHYARYGLDDGFVFPTTTPMQCPRCAKREPSELVAQITRAWRTSADACNPSCRVIAWNWSWSIWYREPQREVIEALPPGVTVMADWERGGSRPWRDTTIAVDEYSLGYPGPSERFMGVRREARDTGRSLMAKLQIGATHEVATVPNIPLISNLHRRWVGLQSQGVAGFMGTWNFGCSLTLNTYAMGHFLSNPAGFRDPERFLHSLARAYLGAADPAAVAQAWEQFARAFDHYPFHIRMLYFSPVNDAPAHPLSFRYEAAPLGPSWIAHDFGDRMEDCLGPFSMAEVGESFGRIEREWTAGVYVYERALTSPVPEAHAREELTCAQMLSRQFRSAWNLFRFHRERQVLVKEHGLTPPCDLPRTESLLAIFRDEIDNARAALPLVESDPRLGYHQEAQAYMYNPAMIRSKIEQMEAELR